VGRGGSDRQAADALRTAADDSASDGEGLTVLLPPDWAQRLAPRIRAARDAKDAHTLSPHPGGIREQDLHRALALLGAELMQTIETLDLVPDRR
jgi:hypothetical protein